MAEKNVIRQDVVQISFDVLDNPMKEVQDMVNGLAAEAKEATSSVDSITKSAKGAADGVGGIATEAQKIKDDNVDDLNKSVQKTTESAKEAEVRFSAMVKALANSVSTKIKSLPKTIQSSASAAREFAASLKAKVFDSPINGAKKLKSNLSAIKNIKLSSVTSGLDKALGKAVLSARKIPEALKTSAVSGFSKIVGSLKSKFEEVNSSAKKLPSVIDKAKGAASELNNGFTILKGTIANLAAQGISNIVGSAVSSVKSLVGEAISASDSMAKFEQTMGFAGYDDKIIKETSKNVKEYADLTVYELDTIANTTAQLAANGIGDFNGLTQAAGNLNAVAGGNADTFNSVAMVLTQTAGAGKLTTENWNQLANAIPGASGRLMDAMKEAGAYTGDFRDAMAKGEITADEFNAAIMKLGNEPIAVEAATSVSTFEGAMGNLQATVVSGIMDIYDTIGRENVAKAITKVSDMVARLIPRIKTVVLWFIKNVPKIAAVFKPVVDAIKNVAGAIFSLATSESTINALKAAFNTVKKAVAPIAQSIGKVISKIAGFIKSESTVKMLKTAFDDVRGVLEPVFGIISDIVGKIAEFATSEPVVNAVKKAFNGISTALHKVMTIAQKVLNFIQKHLDIILPLVVGVTSAWVAYKTAMLVITGVMRAYAAVQWLVNAAMTANPIGLIITGIGLLIGVIILLVKNWDTVKETAATCWEGIKMIWGAVASWFKETVITPIVNFFSDMWEGIKLIFSTVGEFFTGVWNTITGIFSGVAAWFAGIFQSAWDGIKSIWNTVGEFFSKIWDAIKKPFVAAAEWFGAKFELVVEAIKKPFKAIGEFFSGVWDKVKGPFEKIGGKVKSGFSTAISWIPGLATGGIVDKPTIAQIGEDGKEAVVPLENNTGWLRLITQEIAKFSGGNYGGNFEATESGSVTNYKEYNEYNEYNPQFTLNMNGASATEDNKRKVKQWVKEAMKEMFDDLDKDNPPAWEV